MDIINVSMEQNQKLNHLDCALKFEYTSKQGCYNSLIEYKTNSVFAIYDTGATRTAMDIYTLSVLTNYSGLEISRLVQQWIDKGRKIIYVNTASGKIDKAIYICLNNVILADYKFPKLYALLNISSELWKNNGRVTMEDGSIKEFAPTVLVGLDIRRSGIPISDGDIEYINNFDYEKYISKWPDGFNTVLSIFKT